MLFATLLIQFCYFFATFFAHFLSFFCPLAISCPALVEGNADWPSSSALTSVGGTCEASFGGTPWRECLADGTWGDIHETCDALYCLGQSDNNAEWPQTRAGLQALGSCIDGFRGSPTRVCQPDGGWNISSTINGCTRTIEGLEVLDCYFRLFFWSFLDVFWMCFGHFWYFLVIFGTLS